MTYSPPIHEGSCQAERLDLPSCDLCSRDAAFDAYASNLHTWAYLCETHAAEAKIHLGTGRGQRVVMPRP